MNIFLTILGGLLLLFSLFIAILSVGFINRNKRISKDIGVSEMNLDKKTFGSPRAGLWLSLIGIIIGAILIMANV